MVTGGGERGLARSFVDNGRWSNRDLGRLGRGTGGQGFPEKRGMEASSEDDQGEDGLGMSKEARVIDCIVSDRARDRAVGWLKGFNERDSCRALLSNRDRKDDTGFW